MNKKFWEAVKGCTFFNESLQDFATPKAKLKKKGNNYEDIRH